jgi:hemerythrin-like domain-containing protein
METYEERPAGSQLTSGERVTQVDKIENSLEGQMKSTEILKHEHQIILTVMEAAAREIRAIIPRGKITTTDNLEKIIDFCLVFVESCHNAKEEEYLLPKMRERGQIEDVGLIKTIVKEHTEGRQLMQRVAEFLPRARVYPIPSNVAGMTANLKSYIELLRAHIDKEDHTLFPLADRLFTSEDQKVILASFDKHEAEEVGAGVHDKYHKLAQELGQGE